MRKLLLLAVTALLLLLMACGEQGIGETGKLIIQAPEQARVSESVVIKVTDEKGKPVPKARLYCPDYLGETDSEGKLVTFFLRAGSYELVARRGEAGQPNFAEGKGAINIVAGVVEVIVFGGIHVGPPPLPGEPPRTNSFRQGMPVKFSITDKGTKQITLPNSAPWKIEDINGKVVFTPVALQVIVPLAPGETKEWSWNQEGNNGNQVKDGTYVVVLHCSEGEYWCSLSIVPETLQ